MKKSILKLTLAFAAMGFGISSFAQVYTFTNCSDTSRFGPTQIMIDTSYKGTTLDATVTINVQGIQEWTVPATATYKIEALGAEGGDGTDSPDTYPGKGAKITGEFYLTAGTVLKILVGQRGGDANIACTGSNRAAGGGGGSFVTDTFNTPYIVAGGGNGDSWGSWNTNGPDALITNTGTGGGIRGLGTGRGGGGGGLIGDGQDYSGAFEGGHSFVNGGVGGARNACSMGEGGFGGGGGTRFEGGGGGGYNGGDVVPSNQYSISYPSYGAGSYNSGTNQADIGAYNSGHGSVTISFCADSAAITPFSPSAICVFDSPITLPVGTPAGGTYSGLGVSGSTFDPSVAGLGTHYVVYTSTNLCNLTTKDSTMISVECGVGIDEKPSLSGASIYPNPTTGLVNIDLVNHRGVINYSISTIEGRIVTQKQGITNSNIVIDLSDKSKGIYFLKIEDATSNKVYKIMKE